MAEEAMLNMISSAICNVIEHMSLPCKKMERSADDEEEVCQAEEQCPTGIEEYENNQGTIPRRRVTRFAVFVIVNEVGCQT